MAEQAKTEETQEKHFEDQLDGEEVEFVFRKHPVVMRKGLVYGMLGPLIGVLPAAVFPSLGFGWFFGGLAAGMVLGALILLPYWINWFYSVFIVTDRRFIQISRQGLFTKSFADMGLDQIQSLNYQIKGAQAALLGYGTLHVQTYMGNLVINNVHQPAKIYKKLITTLHDKGVESTKLADVESLADDLKGDEDSSGPINEEFLDAEEV